jgi:hypothetical protein
MTAVRGFAMFDNMSYDTGWQLVTDRRRHHLGVADWRTRVPQSIRRHGADREGGHPRRGGVLTSDE